MPHLKIAGGVRISLNYAQFLAQRDHDVKVLVISTKWWRRNLVNILGIKTRWYRGFKPKVVRVKSFKSQDIPNAEIAIFGSSKGAENILDYPKEKGKVFQFVMHDERLYHGDRKKISKIFAQPVKKLVISTWLKEMLKNDFNQESELFVTPVEQALFYPVKAEKKDNDIRILMMHHTYAWKGVPEGLATIKAVKKQIPNIKLVMFGVRKEKPEEFCDEYHYNLPQNELAKLYSSCDIFLCPSEWEGLGMPGMEAMACGSCLVTFDTGGSRDYAIDGQTAFVAKHWDVEDLTKKLLQACQDKGLRKKIAKQGQKFITEDLENWEESAIRLEKVLKDSLSK